MIVPARPVETWATGAEQSLRALATRIDRRSREAAQALRFWQRAAVSGALPAEVERRRLAFRAALGSLRAELLAGAETAEAIE